MQEDLFAIGFGASAGGVAALLDIAAALPRDFPAYLFAVQHIGSNYSILPQLMRARGASDAAQPEDGDLPRPGTIYVAPPDLHMLVERGRIRLFRGPKENHCRPAVDPLFRSLALDFRSRAVGVVLTGNLDDGTAGLSAIKDCGGQAIVQDPATAFEPGMPRSAVDNVDVDWTLPLAEIVPTLLRLVATRPAPITRHAVPEHLRREQLVHHGRHAMENLQAIGQPTSLTCPDCGGGLWEIKEQPPLRYRCHTGHAFTVRSLDHSQRVVAEHSAWSGVRALREREMLLRRVATAARAHGDRVQAEAGERQADRARDQAEQLLRAIEERNGGA